MRRRCLSYPADTIGDVHGKRFNMAGELLDHNPKAPRATIVVGVRPGHPRDALLTMLQTVMLRDRLRAR